MIYELNHFGIAIKNLDVSLAFYQGTLGAKVVYRGFIPATKTDVVYLLISDGLIELLHTPKPPKDAIFGINHIAFMSDDLDADYARLTALGNTGLVAPKPAGSGVGRLAFLSDPNGARVELIQRDLPMRDEIVDHKIIKEFSHFTLSSSRLDAAATFYQSQMGMQFQNSSDDQSKNSICTHLNFGSDVLRLFHSSQSNRPNSIFRHFALRVDSLSDALLYLADKGVQPDHGSENTDANSAIICDPDGVRIKLLVDPAPRS